jgi:hypothetical protein
MVKLTECGKQAVLDREARLGPVAVAARRGGSRRGVAARSLSASGRPFSASSVRRPSTSSVGVSACSRRASRRSSAGSPCASASSPTRPSRRGCRSSTEGATRAPRPQQASSSSATVGALIRRALLPIRDRYLGAHAARPSYARLPGRCPRSGRPAPAPRSLTKARPCPGCGVCLADRALQVRAPWRDVPCIRNLRGLARRAPLSRKRGTSRRSSSATEIGGQARHLQVANRGGGVRPTFTIAAAGSENRPSASQAWPTSDA